MYYISSIYIYYAKLGRTDNATNSPNDTTTPPAPPQFALANVHLEGSPWKHKDRVSQLRSAEKSFVTRKANCRIICGDFNAGADNVLCNILEMAGYVGGSCPTATWQSVAVNE
jgi:hypothetical protein